MTKPNRFSSFRPANLLFVCALGAGILLLFPAAGIAASGERAVEEAPAAIKYLGFYTGGSTPILTGIPTSRTLQTKADIEQRVDNIANAIGQTGDHFHTQLGFWVGPLGWELSEQETRQLIDDAFAVAEEKNIAVGFHIEDSMFWNNRQDLWSDRNNVEWSDWKGTAVPHRIVG